MRVDTKVFIVDTKEVGYIERVLDNGDRYMVRIPSSEGWPYPHHVYVDKERVRNVAKGNDKEEEALL